MVAWQPPTELPDLRHAGIIALDTETNDEGLRADRGSAWPWHGGYVCGISIAYCADGSIRAHYLPLRHPDTANFDPAQVFAWLKDLVASDVRIVTQNGLYDWGWIRSDAGILMPPADRLEEIGALATLIDENRFSYGLDALCAWRGLPGKDTALLHETVTAAGWAPHKRSINVAEYIHRLPAHVVGPYAEADAIATLALFEDLNPILDREGTRDAYRLEIDLLPMVHEMRRRGIRIDQGAAERARDLILQKRGAALAELSEKLGTATGMDEIGSPKWKARTFDAHKICYPRTEKGNPSFKAGKLGWMAGHAHWLPQLIAAANKYDAASSKFLEGHILAHLVNGRVYAEINPHRSDSGGTRSFRFSYSNPPLQQMPARDKELAPLIRGVFLPEEGEVWAKPDISQQEFRLLVHYACLRNLPQAKQAAELYRTNPDADFHATVAQMTGLERDTAKAVNFAKIYGAGVKKFAEMIGKPLNEAQGIYQQYDRRLPFVLRLATVCQREAKQLGYTKLYDGARRHWDRWAPKTYSKGAGPCSLEEAKRRTLDSGHPWFDEWLHRADVHTALNALIQGSAARHTKLWMRACWREGIVPMLQMHDALDCSVTTREQGELITRLGCEAVTLEVPMRADLKFGKSWGDATHSWDELHGIAAPAAATEIASTQPEIGFSGHTKMPDDTDFRTSELPTGSQSDHNLAAAENDANGVGADELPLQPSTPEPAHLCAQCHLDPPDGSERPSAYDERWLHARCEDAFITARMAEEGLAQSSQSAPHSSGNGKAASSNTHDGYPRGEHEVGREAAEYIYRDMKGALYLKVVKRVTKQGKSYPQYHLENGHWVKGKPNGPAIPYRLPELLAAPPGATVWIAEGEQCANTLAALGLVATTNPSGAGKWTLDLNKWLAGFPVAYVLEDNDAAGRDHVSKVVTALNSTIPDVRVLTFHELPEHGDIADWVNAGGTLEQLLERAKQAPKFSALECVCAADEEIAALEWIWPGRFAIGKIGLLVGLPDEGKGLAFSDIMARITRGSPWPCNEGYAPLGNVLLLTAEDDINDTIIPRLIAADADLKRVMIVKMMHEAGKERMFSLVSDLSALRQKIVNVGNVKMILIDPITAYLGIGEVDSYRTTDVRAVLGPLVDLAGELRVSILAIMHFNKKVDVTNVLLRISDSLAYGATARHAYGIVDDEENNRKLFVKGKNNLAPKDQMTLAFSIDVREVGTDKKTGKQIIAPFITWHPEPVDITATEALQAAAESKSPSARDDAKRFIEAQLSNGPVGATDVQEAAKANGISPRTLRRANEDFGAEIKRDGPIVNGVHTWRWHPPKKPKGESQ